MIYHGGDIYAASRRTGIPADEIIDFSASINPLGIPEGALRLASGDTCRLTHYPEPYAEGLSAAIAARLGVGAEGVICGNGSTELIYLVPRALRPSKVLITAPTFGEYERACRNAGAADIVYLALESDRGFELQPRGVHRGDGRGRAPSVGPPRRRAEGVRHGLPVQPEQPHRAARRKGRCPRDSRSRAGDGLLPRGR